MTSTRGARNIFNTYITKFRESATTQEMEEYENNGMSLMDLYASVLEGMLMVSLLI